MKLWEGRFDAPTAADADAFNESLSFDKKLYRVDITASIAHASMLGETGIIPKEDSERIQEGLKGILKDIDEGTLPVEGAEDIHSFVENTLVSRIGEVGKKLHTARSRNDQVATDLRLYIRGSIDRITHLLHAFVTTLTSTSSAFSPAIPTCGRHSPSTLPSTSTPIPRCSCATWSASRTAESAST